MNELTFAGIYTRRIPIRVDLELDEQGKIISHIESWDNNSGPTPWLAVNRSINSWLLTHLA